MRSCSRTVAAGVALSLLAEGCAPLAMARNGTDGMTPAATRQGAVVLPFKSCPSGADVPAEGQRAAAALPLIGFAVDALFGAIGKAIEKRKKELNGQFLATGTLPGAGSAGAGGTAAAIDDLGCLVVLRGAFGSGGTGTFRVNNENGSEIPLDQLGLATSPEFYLELAVEKAAQEPKGDGVAAPVTVMLSPVALRYAVTSARRIGSGEKTVTVAIAMGKKAVKSGEQAEKEALAVFRHNLGRLRVGRGYWDPESDDLLQGTASLQTLAPDALSSLNLAAIVTESEEPGIALEALSEAFAGNKDALANALKEALGAGK